MPFFCFCCRAEYRSRESLRFDKRARQRLSRESAAFLVFLPRGSRYVAAYDALDGEDCRFAAQHRSTIELVTICAQRFDLVHDLVEAGGDHVVLESSLE